MKQFWKNTQTSFFLTYWKRFLIFQFRQLWSLLCIIFYIFLWVDRIHGLRFQRRTSHATHASHRKQFFSETRVCTSCSARLVGRAVPSQASAQDSRLSLASVLLCAPRRVKLYNRDLKPTCLCLLVGLYCEVKSHWHALFCIVNFYMFKQRFCTRVNTVELS